MSVLLDLLECPVCLERLDATAKVLPCQHTFCRRCLQGIVGSRGELRCPECRTLVECAVDELPSNILLVRLLDGIKQRPRRAGPGAGACTNGTSGAVARAHSSGSREQGTPGAQPMLYSHTYFCLTMCLLWLDRRRSDTTGETEQRPGEGRGKGFTFAIYR
uniref:RING-type domain-containing protein n=1 Tax=Periophthalmus magnuspinnatus TaxID=409849 RepID=A0A3B4AD07_9GOBI